MRINSHTFFVVVVVAIIISVLIIIISVLISVLIVCKHEYLEWDMVMSTSKLFPIGIKHFLDRLQI